MLFNYHIAAHWYRANQFLECGLAGENLHWRFELGFSKPYFRFSSRLLSHFPNQYFFNTKTNNEIEVKHKIQCCAVSELCFKVDTSLHCMCLMITKRSDPWMKLHCNSKLVKFAQVVNLWLIQLTIAILIGFVERIFEGVFWNNY